MRSLYPSSSAKQGNLLKNLNKDEKAHGMVYYCEQCGFACNDKKVKVVQRYGNDNESSATITTETSTTVALGTCTYPKTVTVQRGYCPFCGSSRSKKT